MDIVFVPKVKIWPCTGCIRFPLIKPAEITADFLHQANGHPSPPNVDSLLRPLVARLITEPQFPSKKIAATIKSNPNTPVFSAAGGGTLFNLHEQLKSEIAVYMCDHCRALYVLPQDVRDAARKVEMAVGPGGMTEDGVKETCIRAMRNAFKGLRIGERGNAEVYLFEEFVVLVCWQDGDEKDRSKDSVKAEDLPIFDVGGFMPA